MVYTIYQSDYGFLSTVITHEYPGEHSSKPRFLFVTLISLLTSLLSEMRKAETDGAAGVVGEGGG